MKVEPPGGSPARRTAPVRRRRVARVRGPQRGQARRRARPGRRRPTSSASTSCSTHADVLVTSGVDLAPGLEARDLATRHPHLVVGALTPFGLDGPVRRLGRHQTRPSPPAAASRSRPVSPSDTPTASRRDTWSTTPPRSPARSASCARCTSVRQTGAGQFVEVAVNEAIAQICRLGVAQRDRRGSRPGSRPAEVRNGNGPIYPIFACKGGYVRLIILSVRQWHAMREWLGEPEYLQDPALDGFIARREIAEHVLNPLFDVALRRPQHGGGVAGGAEAWHRLHARAHARPTSSPTSTSGHGARSSTSRWRRASPRRSRPGTSRSTASAPARRRHRPAVGEHTAAVFASLGDARDAPTGHVSAEPAARRSAGDGLRARRGRRGGGPSLRRVRRRGHEDRVAHLHRLHAPAARRRDEPVVRVVEPVQARVRRERQDATTGAPSSTSWRRSPISSSRTTRPAPWTSSASGSTRSRR